MSLPLIGLKGERRAGKDTVAGILIAKHGYTRRAFADNLKMEIFVALGRAMLIHHGIEPMHATFTYWMSFLDEHKNDPADSEFGWVGPLLQFWGTEYRRHKCGETYWLDQLEAQLGPAVVVTDIRFPNEADLIRKHGGVIWHVERPGAQEDGGARGSSHASEALVHTIKADFTIGNTGTLEHLADQVAQALQLSWLKKEAA